MKLHLDNGNAEHARAVLDKYPEDSSMVFVYSRALIEFISLSLKEDGSSQELVVNAMRKGSFPTLLSTYALMDDIYSYDNQSILVLDDRIP